MINLELPARYLLSGADYAANVHYAHVMVRVAPHLTDEHVGVLCERSPRQRLRGHDAAQNHRCHACGRNMLAALVYKLDVGCSACRGAKTVVDTSDCRACWMPGFT